MQAHTFKPDRGHLLALILMTLTGLLIISWAPIKLGWLLIFPLLALWWILRASTHVDDNAITVTHAFSGQKKISWDQFQGLEFKGAKALAKLRNGQSVRLPGVTFNSLPALARASRGRIPDALTAGKHAAEEKVVVIHRDGQQVLLNKEEFAQYKREHPNAVLVEKPQTSETPEA